MAEARHNQAGADMHVTIDKKAGFAMFDELVTRRKENLYPFNRRDAVIPQDIIPPEIRKDKRLLACFYFYICIYMRGGIESLQAFNAMIKMWRAHPDLFDPLLARFRSPQDIQPIIKKFIGWNSKAASINWVYNSRQLAEHWGADPLNLLKGMRNYDEALKRIKNKRTKREQKEVGHYKYWGFRGFQPKMVSMLIYFFDWEGWLKPRFLYPSPADFHNFRLGFANGVIKVELKPGEEFVRTNEKISAPWRRLVMEYLRARRVDPVLFADAVWLYSLVLCGNSPITMTKVLKPRIIRVKTKSGQKIEKPNPGLFEHAGANEEWHPARWAARKHRQLEQTCLACALSHTCSMAIPSQPYYRKGRLFLHPRPRVERNYSRILPPPRRQDVVIEPEVLALLPGLYHHQAAAE